MSIFCAASHSHNSKNPLNLHRRLPHGRLVSNGRIGCAPVPSPLPATAAKKLVPEYWRIAPGGL